MEENNILAPCHRNSPYVSYLLAQEKTLMHEVKGNDRISTAGIFLVMTTAWPQNSIDDPEVINIIELCLLLHQCCGMGPNLSSL